MTEAIELGENGAIYWTHKNLKPPARMASWMNTRGAALRFVNRLQTIENGRSLETCGLTVIDTDSKMQHCRDA